MSRAARDLRAHWRTVPRAPGHLRPETRRWWRSVVADYELEPHHIMLLIAAAEAWDRMCQAREAIADAPYVTGRYGLRQHPALAVERDSRIAFARLMRELDLDSSVTPEAPRPPGRR